MNSAYKTIPPIALAVTLAMATAIADSPPWAESSLDIGRIGDLPSGELSSEELSNLTDVGQALFATKFIALDGAGRPAATQAIIPTKARHANGQSFSRLPGPDAQACSSCHNDPVIGGAGDFVTNVFVSVGFTNANFDTSDPQFSNERGTNHLFGAGLLELLSREMSAELSNLRANALKTARDSGKSTTVELLTKGVSFGQLTALPDGLVDLSRVEGIDTDLVVRPFSQKGVMTSLRQFTVNALNHHHGMQSTERFGARWTSESDFDEDGVDNEIAEADVSALVAWQATLRPPVESSPDNAAWQTAARSGREAFVSMGCQSCHRSDLPLESLSFSDPGPLDVAGTLNRWQVESPAIYDLALLDWAATLPKDENGHTLIPLFGDLKRHKMTDNSVSVLGNELLSQRFVGRDTFMTAELWGVASTAPYGHRNDLTTLHEIIMAHGGAGRSARNAYIDASDEDRSAIIAFLKTLVIQ